MRTKEDNPLRKYGKTIFKLLENRWLKELPVGGEEKERDKFKGEEIKEKIVRAAIG